MKFPAYIILLLSSIYFADVLSISFIECPPQIESCNIDIESCGKKSNSEQCCAMDMAACSEGEEEQDCSDSPDCPATCNNCPFNYISTFEETFTLRHPAKYISIEYSCHPDHFKSRYSSDAWKPPNTI